MTRLVLPGVLCQDDAPASSGMVERSSPSLPWSRSLAFAAAFVSTGNPVALIEAVPGFPGASASISRVTAQLPEDVAKAPECRIAEVPSTPCPTDRAFEAAVSGMASQFAADETPSTVAPVTEAVAAATEIVPVPTQPVCAEPAPPAASTTAVEVVVAPSAETTNSVAVEPLAPVEVAAIAPEPIPAPAPAPAETAPVVAVPEGVPAIVPPVDPAVASDPFDLYPELAFELNHEDDGPGVPAEPVIARENAAAPGPASLVETEQTEVVVPPSPAPEAIAQAEISPVPMAPAPEAAPAGGTIEPDVTPATDATAPSAATPEAAAEVSAAPETAPTPVVEPTERDQRLASAVRLTGEAIQAWAAVLSERHELASGPGPLTR